MINNNVKDSSVKVNGGHVDKIEFITNVFVSRDDDLKEAGEWKERLMATLEKLPSKADTLKPMLEFLIGALEPSKIFMLQHEGEAKDEKYFDLLIVLQKASSSFPGIEAILDMSYLKDKRVSCSLHNEGSVLEGLKSGNVFYTLNFTPSNLVYAKTSTLYPVATAEQTTVMRAKAKDIFTKGFEKAQNFYACGETELNKGNNELSLFLLHQAVELTFRSILQSLIDHNIREHEIKVLQRHIRRYTPQLVAIFNEDNKQEKELLTTLEKGYIATRYDIGYSVNSNILPLLLERVKLFQDTAFSVVKRIIGEYFFETDNGTQPEVIKS